MDKIQIIGGNKLHGAIKISGAKNAALPLMCACLLTDRPLTLLNVPHLADVSTMVGLLASMGVSVEVDGNNYTENGHQGRVIKLCAKETTSQKADYDLVRKMRASVLVLGPLLARFGKAMVSLPGGCAIGTRPVDLHLKAMELLGATIELDNGYIFAEAKNGLRGTEINFPFASVGATENAMMAATIAVGQTVINNAAREPEIADLANCLNAMGAKISGIDSTTLVIQGVGSLKDATHSICPDRIEAGTYAVAAAVCGGEVRLEGARAGDLQSLLNILRQIGVEILEDKNGITVVRSAAFLSGLNIETQPFPGFPTDLQAQIMTLLTLSKGRSELIETIFENRFMHVPELIRMGADILVEGSKAKITGVPKLKGAQVMATDLRASVSLVLAGLVAEGKTTINRIYHLDRGYESIEDKLSACGANIQRIKG